MDCYCCQDMKLFYRNVKNKVYVNELEINFQNSFFSELPLVLFFSGVSLLAHCTHYRRGIQAASLIFGDRRG